MNHASLLKIDGFDQLPAQSQNQLIEHTTLKSFNVGNILFYKGDTPKYFYVFLEGELKSYRNDKKFNEITIHHIKAQGFFAELASLKGVPFPSSCVALQISHVALIERNFFMNFLFEHKVLVNLLLHSLSDKVRILQRVIDQNLVFDALSKVASYVDANPCGLVVNKKQEIAKRLNMAPETLSRSIAKLKTLDILDDKGALKNVNKLLSLLSEA